MFQWIRNLLDRPKKIDCDADVNVYVKVGFTDRQFDILMRYLKGPPGPPKVKKGGD